ncbi:hypothetical protein SAY86_020773 [Trapa natans]|uniref:Uncharacterized protein n=1 Tax=Trapa natans TaxID=22666 RepID=A0AAN7MSN8_TRANT|nr:hypothetical protein SAY86_020773 [Trapa natans]
MTTLGFENYVGPLKIYLNRYRETEGEKINSMARQQEDNNCGGGGFGGFIKEMPKIGGPLGGSLGISRGTDFQSLYGQSLISGAGGLGLNRIHDNGDANGGRAVAAQIHNGVGW